MSFSYAHKGIEIIEEDIRNEHVHMLRSIPQKMRQSNVMGYLKSKASAGAASDFEATGKYNF